MDTKLFHPRPSTPTLQPPGEGSVPDTFCVTRSTPSPEASEYDTLPSSTPPALRHLKGHKKFIADLSELSARPNLISHSGQWSVKSVKPGDEETSLEIVVTHAGQKQVLTIILVVSDTSLYPDEHAYCGYSQDAGALESDIACVIDKLSTKTGRTLQKVVGFFVEALASGGDHDSDDGDNIDDGESDDVIFEEDFEQTDRLNSSQTPQLSLGHLKKDFLEVEAAGYSPGIIWTRNNRFIVSVSLPVSDLFQHIHPHALLAWDRNFLQPGFNLTLLIAGFREVYPVLQEDGTLAPSLLLQGSSLKFKVGFTQDYKPSRECATSAFREFFARDAKDMSDGTSEPCKLNVANDPDPGVFRTMSLSTCLESLLDQQLLRLLQIRRKFNLGWAGAEELLWQVEMTHEDPATIYQQKKEEVELAELHEKKLNELNNLPSDPIDTCSSEMNIIKISFVFMLRRLALSTRHCVVCHKRLPKCESLRPYACSSGLCVFQYYFLNLGPSIEQEIITNTASVDLLVSLAYVAAVEGVLDEPLPRGMGLRVRAPKKSDVLVDEDGLCEFDSLSLPDMRKVITGLLESLPPITKMKNYLQQQLLTGNTKVQLNDISATVLPAAWSILRWCVASCTAHIEEITNPEDRLRNMGNYQQFRFLVGAPDKEKKFLTALPQGNHPAIFAFHGSPLRNWHSIIRHGLWVTETAAHGRSHGDGVYFCQDASVPLGKYAKPSSALWRNSTTKPMACCTLAEIVNRRESFVYNKPPYFVVDNTEWIMCRYLLVRTSSGNPNNDEEPNVGKYLSQERGVSTTSGTMKVDIPQPSYQLDKLVRACILGREEITLADEDRAIIFDVPHEELSGSGSNESFHTATDATPPRSACTGNVWESDDKWILRSAQELLAPPSESSLVASATLRREFKAMMLEQRVAQDRDDLATLGWYLPPQHNQDNLYQWLVELHSFDPELPIAKEMKAIGVPSVAMEIRFPPSFPHAPPFFRVIRPRFLRSMEGGGGHVTVGGSICMDLLTSDGWLPSYTVSAVLLQIKLAMSSTRCPARLHDNWDKAYTPDEALKGYIRAAGIHKWKIKNEAEIRKLMAVR